MMHCLKPVIIFMRLHHFVFLYKNCLPVLLIRLKNAMKQILEHGLSDKSERQVKALE